MEAWLQHGTGTAGPFHTEGVEVRVTDAPPNPYTTGYGKAVPTQYMVRFERHWRRVYCMIYSNIGTLYVVYKGVRINVRIDE